MAEQKELIKDKIIFSELNQIFSYKSKLKENSKIIERGFVCSKIKNGRVLFVRLIRLLKA
jgi:hypothetical protein